MALGNDEPGVMEPGHCFTIEVCLSVLFPLNLRLIYPVFSLQSFRAMTLKGGFFQMDGLRQPRYAIECNHVPVN